MHRRPFCYMHWRLSDHKLPVTEPGYVPPVIDSEASVVLASEQIMRGVLSGKLDVRRAQVAMSFVRLAAQAMRNQLNVASRTETALTPAMTEHFAVVVQAQAEYEKKCSEDQQAAVILNEDARPGEGPRRPGPHPEDLRTFDQPSAPNNSAAADVTSNFFASPIASTPVDSELNEQQLSHCRFVLRYGPSHPEFNDCTRRLDANIATRVTA